MHSPILYALLSIIKQIHWWKNRGDPGLCFTQKSGFTQEDRERLVRVEATLKVFMEQVHKRFDQMMNFLWMLVTIFSSFGLL